MEPPIPKQSMPKKIKQAEASPLSMEELSKKLVQEISRRGDEIPERYIINDGFPEAIDSPIELWRDTLLIDFSLLSSFDEGELAKLKSALSNWGCCQLINHGIKKSFLEELIRLSEQFFALPLEEKLKWRQGDEKLQGYAWDLGSIGIEVGWSDRLFLTLHPFNPQSWPQKPQKLREILEEYGKKLKAITQDIYKAMARSLDLEEDCFLKNVNQASILGSLALYPPCSSPERVLGIRPHSDGDVITLVLPGEEGLQAQKDGQWFKVPIIPGALFMNVGDMAEVMSNGIFKSVMHRVVTNSAKDRVSWSAFCGPNEGIQLAPVSELISADQPQLFKELDMAQFREAIAKNPLPAQRLRDSLKI